MLPTDLIGLAVVEFATEPSSWQSALRRWSTWVLVCSAGGTAATAFVGILVSYVLPTILALNNGPMWFATLALGVGVAAALFAMPQWIVLRHQIPHASRWIITTAWSGILGRLLASGGFDGTVRLWEAGTGTPVRLLRPERRYERLDITGLTGISNAQRAALLALGAVEQHGPPG